MWNEANYGPETYGETYADVYDDWYGEGGQMAISQVGAPDEVADGIVALADGGPVLELGVGTGRLALPLADRGLDVTGLDASPAMLERLRAKPGADRLTVVEGDMADPLPGAADGSFGVVLVGFNTLFNLTTAGAQASCVAAGARLLRPGGRFVVEAFVPAPEAHDGMSVRAIEVDRVLLDVATIDPDTQLITGQRIEVSEAGNRLFPYQLRYVTPEQLDALAADADLSLEHRWADWSGTPFDEASASHVSVWRRT
ncbi:MAG: class I SAM-dependent methyltransferase [Actinobacteria bacterium]|nr:class I SAM-dependent methyltransferase [Actinomycetota bacterium]